jgi:hypothetical protein
MSRARRQHADGIVILTDDDLMVSHTSPQMLCQ